jgi:cysteine-rich repeat protein
LPRASPKLQRNSDLRERYDFQPDGSTCDDGNACTQTDECASGICTGTPIPDCHVCGDGSLDPGEQCDDSNTTNGDGCNGGCRYELIPGDGNGSRNRDAHACRLEWAVVNPHNAPATDKHGRPHFKQTCANNDPSCDFGSDPDACEFRVVACLNNVDPQLPTCPATGVRDPVRVMVMGAARDGANHDAVMTALANLRDPATGGSGLTTPLAAAQVDMCTASFTIRVPLRGPSTKRHAARVRLSAVTRAPADTRPPLVDVDRLMLVCTP